MNVTNILNQIQQDSWRPINLNQLPASPPVKPNLANTNLIYPGLRHVFSGPPESAKTLAAYAILIHNGRDDSVGVLIDFEMGPYDARQRLIELGAGPDELERILYIHPNEPATSDRMVAILAYEPSLVVIDASVGAFELQGLDDNKRTEVQRLTSLFVDTFWNHQIATIMIDHVVKDVMTRGRYAIGSERKLGGADVHIGFDTIKPVSRGTAGRYKLIVHKDRGGYHKRGHLADFKLESDPETHQIAWSFTEPASSSDSEGHFRPTGKMERVSTLLETATEPLSRNAVFDAIGGDRNAVFAAIDALVREGFADETDGPRRAKLVTHSRRYRESDPGCNPETSTSNSLVCEWFGSGMADQSEVSGMVVCPPYGDIPTNTTSPSPTESNGGMAATTTHSGQGWFTDNGHLADAYYDQIELPDEEL